MEWYEKLMLGFFIAIFVGALTALVAIKINNPPAQIFWMLIEEEEEK